MSMKKQLAELLEENCRRFGLRFASATEMENLEQDEEWCEVRVDGQWKRIRLHDYHEIYEIPGLYEKLFHRTLRCTSPGRVVGLFEEVLKDWPGEAQPKCVLDVGAGGGMIGEQILERTGAEKVIGIDLISQAREAAMRDRPWVYDEYIVANLCDLSERTEKRMREMRPDCMVSVAALGFGDIPIKAFMTALDVIETPGWVVFNIREHFLNESGDTSGFAGLIHKLRANEVLRIEAFRRYRHRISTQGKPLHYVAVVARKLRDVDDDFME